MPSAHRSIVPGFTAGVLALSILAGSASSHPLRCGVPVPPVSAATAAPAQGGTTLRAGWVPPLSAVFPEGADRHELRYEWSTKEPAETRGSRRSATDAFALTLRPVGTGSDSRSADPSRARYDVLRVYRC